MSKTNSFGKGLQIAKLRGLVEELQGLRNHPPLVSRGEGKYEGDILGFVKGLRLSARIIYILRDALSDKSEYEINWGHLVNSEGSYCSSECDIVVHTKGYLQKWNGHHDHPVMDFRFIKAEQAKVVISCKSTLDKIDKEYPESLKKFGVKKVFLLAECCKETRYMGMKQKAHRVGYSGLWCLYLTSKGNDYRIDETMHIDFLDTIKKVLDK